MADETPRITEVAHLWRCSDCGKWSHAKRKPRGHQRFISADDVDNEPSNVIRVEPGSLGYDGDEDAGGWWVQCGPFVEFLALPESEVARLRAVVADQQTRLDAVLTLHHETPNPWWGWGEGMTVTETFGPTECAHDYKRWPCPTALAAGSGDGREAPAKRQQWGGSVQPMPDPYLPRSLHREG